MNVAQVAQRTFAAMSQRALCENHDVAVLDQRLKNAKLH
jgi:hypothetical protein